MAYIFSGYASINDVRASYGLDPLPEAPDTFEIGDVVNLVVGGPDMTVVGVCDECGTVEVAWFDGDDESGWVFHREVFPEEALV